MPWSKIHPQETEPFFQAGQNCGTRLLPYHEAIREALRQAMELDERVFVMGQGVDDPGGMFGATLGLHKEFGSERVFDTPLSETSLTGVAVGAAIAGARPVYFHNRPDFLTLAMDQLVNHAAKWRFMFGGQVGVPLVIWACTGRGWGSAAQHSQALHGLFLHVPGLKVVMPGTAHDAKGLLLQAIADEDPVLVLEHRFNFKHKGYVPEEVYTVPFGRAIVRRPGSDVTIVAVSYMVNEAFVAAEELAKSGVQAEVLDLRTIRPLDEEAILHSLSKTGRLVVADTGWKVGGMAAEVAAVAAEKGFELLKAPVARITCPDTPTPASHVLEQAFYRGANDIIKAVQQVLGRPACAA